MPLQAGLEPAGELTGDELSVLLEVLAAEGCIMLIEPEEGAQHNHAGKDTNNCRIEASGQHK
jgi:hypothetical protein